MRFESGSATPTVERADRSTNDLLSRLLDDASALVRNELALAKAELLQSANAIKLGMASMAAGSIIAIAGALTLVAAAVLGLAQVIAPWLAALLIGGVLSIAGFLLIQAAKHKLTGNDLKLDHTEHSLRKDAAVAARRT